MYDDLVNEYAAYAEGDDEANHVAIKEEDVSETPAPSFFADDY